MSKNVIGLKPRYYVIFPTATELADLSPISPLRMEEQGGTKEHGFDLELYCILPAIWYCLHLPRLALDAVDLPVRTLSSHYNSPHEIIVLPLKALMEGRVRQLLENAPPSIVITLDEFYLETKSLFTEEPLLVLLRQSELSDETLKKHWASLAKCVPNAPVLKVNLHILPFPDGLKVIPHLFLSNQFGVQDNAYELLAQGEDFEDSIFFGQAPEPLLSAANEEIARLVQGYRADILLIPFNVVRFGNNDRTNGLELLALLRERVAWTRNVMAIMPVSVFARAAFQGTIAKHPALNLYVLFEDELASPELPKKITQVCGRASGRLSHS